MDMDTVGSFDMAEGGGSVKIAIATLVTGSALGLVLYLHGEQEGVAWQEAIGLCLLLLAIFGTFWGGLFLLWRWALT